MPFPTAKRALMFPVSLKRAQQALAVEEVQALTISNHNVPWHTASNNF